MLTYTYGDGYHVFFATILYFSACNERQKYV
jgi:hypothetical protein